MRIPKQHILKHSAPIVNKMCSEEDSEHQGFKNKIHYFYGEQEDVTSEQRCQCGEVSKSEALRRSDWRNEINGN